MSTWSKLFSAHLRKRGLTGQDAAFALKVSPSQVHYWLHGRTPREQMQQRIAEWSEGKVPTVDELERHRPTGTG